MGCSDSSENKHATKHFHDPKHLIVQTIEPGESWAWCYVDGRLFYATGNAGQRLSRAMLNP
jgi:hypothetical protein